MAADEVVVSTDIAAPAEAVYALVADLPRMGEWSPECVTVSWRGGATGAAAGAKFVGRNKLGRRSWSTVSTIVTCEPGREIGWEVRAFGMPVSYWSYTLTSAPGGCSVSERWVDRRGGLLRTVGGPVTGVSDRATHNRAGMTETLANLKAAVER